MSFSDYIQLKKLKQVKNTRPFLDSSNYTENKLKLCAVLDTLEVDEYGDTVPHSLFGISILQNLNNCPVNTFDGKVTKPIMFKPPSMTTQNVKTSKNMRSCKGTECSSADKGCHYDPIRLRRYAPIRCVAKLP